MRNIAPIDTPSLFSPEALLSPPAVEETQGQAAPDAYKLARDFVAWCCSFGTSFRNSPDATNLRFWMRKTGVTLDIAEQDLLFQARRLLLKRLQQSLTKSEEHRDGD